MLSPEQFADLHRFYEGLAKSFLNTVVHDWREKYGDTAAHIMAMESVVHFTGGVVSGFGAKGGPAVQRALAEAVSHGVKRYVEDAIEAIESGDTSAIVEIKAAPLAPTEGHA